MCTGTEHWKFGDTDDVLSQVTDVPVRTDWFDPSIIGSRRELILPSVAHPLMGRRRRGSSYIAYSGLREPRPPTTPGRMFLRDGTKGWEGVGKGLSERYREILVEILCTERECRTKPPDEDPLGLDSVRG